MTPTRGASLLVVVGANLIRETSLPFLDMQIHEVGGHIWSYMPNLEGSLDPLFLDNKICYTLLTPHEGKHYWKAMGCMERKGQYHSYDMTYAQKVFNVHSLHHKASKRTHVLAPIKGIIPHTHVIGSIINIVEGIQKD
ncbi:hypothetical protein ACJX0J_038306 [Zea mays]